MERQFLDMNPNEERMRSNEEIEQGCSSDNADNDQRPKRKRYTLRQIQELEAFYEECSHPDGRQRKELSELLGMEVLQIKFWFQNRRTQLKAKQERGETSKLRDENEKLRMENMQYKEALSNPCCAACASSSSISFEELRMRMENARLREEVEKIAAMVAEYVGKPVPFTDSGAGATTTTICSAVDRPQLTINQEFQLRNGC